MTTVGIVGAGTMGAGIAQVAAAAGHPVLLFDTRAGAADKAVAAVLAMFAKLAAKGKMTSDAASAASARLAPAARLDHFAPCGLVLEAIVEDLAAKRALLQALEPLVAPDCLLATNTSSLSLAAMSTALREPGRLVGMHFFNPAPLMELVEVVGGVATHPDALQRVEDLARAWGKLPVRARATPGFIVNRVARPFYAEGLRLLAEQACSPATLDAVLRECGGFRMGPCELTDLIGQDVNFAVTRSVFESFYFDPRFSPSLVQQELVEAGWLGRKSGRGFFTYGEGAAAPVPDTEPPQSAPTGVILTGTAALRHRLEQAGVNVVSGPALQTSDGRTAAQTGAAVLDLALDYAAAKRAAVAFPPDFAPEHRAMVVASLQAAGFAVSILRDLPGLAVLRTVAMLANEAGDAVHFGVASPADVDLAMRKGVNYPLGPLEWAQRLGPGFLRQALDHIHRYYGEPRYRISPGLP